MRWVLDGGGGCTRWASHLPWRDLLKQVLKDRGGDSDGSLESLLREVLPWESMDALVAMAKRPVFKLQASRLRALRADSSRSQTAWRMVHKASCGNVTGGLLQSLYTFFKANYKKYSTGIEKSQRCHVLGYL